LHDHAHSCYRGTQQRLAIVGAELSANWDLNDIVASRKTPDVARSPNCKIKQRMAFKFGRMRRHTIACDLTGTGHGEHARHGERARDQPIVERAAHSHTAVEAFFREINHAIIQTQVHFHLRVRSKVVADHWRKPMGTKRYGRRDPEYALRHSVQRVGNAVGGLHGR
jgi:hypothetical protein